MKTRKVGLVSYVHTCTYCKKEGLPLLRTVPKGQACDKWACLDCLKKHHPNMIRLDTMQDYEIAMAINKALNNG